MALVKTAKGSAAMASRDESLTAKARQLIVMSDGKRDRKAMEAVFGPSCFKLMDQLVADGFLHDASPTTQSHENEVSPRPPIMLLAEKTPESTRHRRSSAGTKMYMIDLLQMMRNREASSLAVNLHTSADANELLDGVLEGLRFMCTAYGVSYSFRVYQRLLEMLPEHQLPKLTQLGDELFVPAVELS